MGAGMIVVDTNIIAYLVLTGDKTKLARQVLESDPHWVVPQLWKHEFLNVLTTNIRQDMLTIEDALQAWQNSQDVLYRREQAVSMTAALQLSAACQISAYDAQFVTLAQSLGVWLVTEDRQLQRKFPDTVCSLAQYAGMNKN